MRTITGTSTSPRYKKCPRFKRRSVWDGAGRSDCGVAKEEHHRLDDWGHAFVVMQVDQMGWWSKDAVSNWEVDFFSFEERAVCKKSNAIEDKLDDEEHWFYSIYRQYILLRWSLLLTEGYSRRLKCRAQIFKSYESSGSDMQIKRTCPVNPQLEI